MRIRNKPWAKPELSECKFFVQEANNNKGNWRFMFKDENAPLHIELGCGKGGFISQLAFSNQHINYIAIDKISNMLGLSKRKIEAQYASGHRDVENVLLTACDIERIFLILGHGDSVERIYINFCNPWYKNGDKKKRLTHTKQLEKYKEFLKVDGEIWFKTDDDQLFSDSLKYFNKSGFQIKYITYDLHNSEFEPNILTEHEIMFSNEGIKIKFLIASLSLKLPENKRVD